MGANVKIDQNKYCNDLYNIFVFDFGKTCTVRPGINVNKISGNGRVELYYNQKFDKTPKSFRGFGGANEGFCDTLIPKDGKNEWKSLTNKGMRFIIVRISGDLKIEFSLDTYMVDYDFPNEQKPDIDNSFISKLWDIGRETI